MNSRQTAVLAVVGLLLSAGVVVAVGGLLDAGPGQDDTVPPTTAPGEQTDGPATTDTTSTGSDEVPSFRYDGNAISVTTAPDQTIRGEVDLPAGAAITVRLQSNSSAQPFLLRTTATVAEDGTFDATVDLSHLDGNTTAQARLFHDDTELASAPVDISYAPSSEPVDDPTSGTSLQYDGERLTLSALDGETVRGTSNLSAGTELTVRVISSSGGQPFLRSTTATVAEDGTFATTVDLEGIANETEFEVRVHHDDERLATAPGVVIGGQNAVAVDFTHFGGEASLDAAPGQVVRGDTSLPPGTNVTVRMASESAESPFLKTQTATVTDTGAFEATFDLSHVEADATIEVSVFYNGSTVATMPGEVDA